MYFAFMRANAQTRCINYAFYSSYINWSGKWKQNKNTHTHCAKINQTSQR